MKSVENRLKSGRPCSVSAPRLMAGQVVIRFQMNQNPLCAIGGIAAELKVSKRTVLKVGGRQAQTLTFQTPEKKIPDRLVRSCKAGS